MSGRLLFREKQLRLCVVAALASIAAPMAQSLVLPPNPLAVNFSSSCRSAADNNFSCISASKNPAPEIRVIPLSPKPVTAGHKDISHDHSGESEALLSLLEAPGEHFVLQWMAARERSQLETLRDRYPVLQKATIAEYKRSGKTWYVLLDGPYSNRKEAMAELETPPRSHMAQELYPWTRSLASIQKLDIIQPDVAEQQIASTAPPALPAHMSNVEPIEYDVSYSSRNQSAYSDPELSIPYGMEFSSSTDFNLDQQTPSRQVRSDSLPENAAPNFAEMTGQYALQDVAFNNQNSGKVVRSRPQEHSVMASAGDVLTANPKRFTIEWMSASRKASLERVQSRYSELKDTQIIHYQSNNQSRYTLVSMLFTDRADAADALLKPSLAKVSARFAPKVRQVGYLQSLTGVESQPASGQLMAASKTTEKDYLADLSQQVDQYRQKSELPGPNSYTIQWFSSSDRQAIDKLKQRFPELAAAKTVHISRNQKDWYVLVQGQYKTSEEAIKALQSPAMKSIAMILHPWTRPLNSLKRLQIASL